jgi:hypothetical protein
VSPVFEPVIVLLKVAMDYVRGAVRLEVGGVRKLKPPTAWGNKTQ